ncbi:transglutaminase family protein [Pseudoroseicyclus sp. CXY001]|uniref:transglutaminase-like domain-containing protein n=1 Tax=Pseudoroseicyclus sp. CXY001 TaxID=3242492 RepID=UPI0035715598
MRLRVGFRIEFQLPQPTPMITLLNIHSSRSGDLESPDGLRAAPAVWLRGYHDGFGNWCTRFVAPAGRFEITSDAVIRDNGQPDPQAPRARQLMVESLPDEMLTFLLGSRYCETDVLQEEAWQRFGQIEGGWDRVQAICDFVHGHIRFDYLEASATRTAAGAFHEARGVCRDFAHLAVTFCRCLNIPARYCTGYLGDVGTPPPHPPGDFAAWMEVYLDGGWHVFDPRNNTPRIGRILIARGRDAADVPLTQTFGASELKGFEVWTDEIG